MFFYSYFARLRFSLRAFRFFSLDGPNTKKCNAAQLKVYIRVIVTESVCSTYCSHKLLRQILFLVSSVEFESAGSNEWLPSNDRSWLTLTVEIDYETI